MPDSTPPLLQALRSWQKVMHAEEPSPEARKLKSQLRRLRSLDGARMLGGLYSVVGDQGRRPYDWEVLAVMLLPYVKTDTDGPPDEDEDKRKGKTFAALAARRADGSSRSAMSEPRFRRLLENETLGDLLLPLVRALRLTGGAASLSGLLRDLRNWENPHARPHPRTDWAHDYYTTLLHA